MIEKTFTKLISFIINNLKLLLLKILHPVNLKYNPINYIAPSATIRLSKKGKIIINRKATANAGTLISSINGGEIILGKGSFINRNCYIVSHKKINIGENAMIGPNTVIVDHDHLFSKHGIDKRIFKKEDITIGKGAWIGANCCILKGVSIGENSIIGAGTIVTKNVPSGAIVTMDNAYRERAIR